VNQKYRQFAAALAVRSLRTTSLLCLYEGLRSSNTQLNRAVKMETPQFEKYVIQQRPTSIAAKIFQTPGFAARIANTVSTTDFGSLDGRPLGTWYVPGTGTGQAIGNGPDGIPDWGIFDVRVPNSSAGDQLNGRLDYKPERTSFFASSYFVRQDSFAGGKRPIEDVNCSPRVGREQWVGSGRSIIRWLTISGANFTRWAFDQLLPTGDTKLRHPRRSGFSTLTPARLGDMSPIGVGQVLLRPPAWRRIHLLTGTLCHGSQGVMPSSSAERRSGNRTTITSLALRVPTISSAVC